MPDIFTMNRVFTSGRIDLNSSISQEFVLVVNYHYKRLAREEIRRKEYNVGYVYVSPSAKKEGCSRNTIPMSFLFLFSAATNFLSNLFFTAGMSICVPLLFEIYGFTLRTI